ncbi:MAG: hypothetical protein JSW39_07425, partial [Desulfobacterales bacterium]
WLRLLGFDTLYEPAVSKANFIQSLGQGRIVLTRTRRFAVKYAAADVIYIKSNHLSDQLRQVIQELGIQRADIKPFSRCIRCNIPIVETAKDSLRGVVPDYIWETHQTFRRCSQCGKIYWPGSHAERSLERIERIFGLEHANHRMFCERPNLIVKADEDDR